MTEVATPGSNVTSTSGSGNDIPEWHFLQCFGERTPGEDIQDAAKIDLKSPTTNGNDSQAVAADIISAVEFDHKGQYLATGDRGGRVVIFEQGSQSTALTPLDERPAPNIGRLGNLEYRYLTEFQSHEPEFDYLKSLEIEEKINQVQWVPHHTSTQLLLSTNDKTVKLWKVYEKQVTSLADYNVRGSWSIPAGAAANVTITPSKTFKAAAKTEEKLRYPLRVPKIVRKNPTPQARCSKVYANAHAYHINSVSLSSDRETFLSADDLRINLWNLDITSCCFNVLDIKPSNMEDLTEVITCAEFHPQQCHQFVYSSSKGGIRLGDLRESALCSRHAKSFELAEPTQRSFFSEIISSISNMKFSRDGRYILARDFMSLKLWDVNMESQPVAVYNVHENLRPKLVELYESDCLFDKFNCCMSGDSSQMLSGTYSNLFRILKKDGDWPGKTETILEASRDPLRRRTSAPKVTSRFGLSRGSAAKRAVAGGPVVGAGLDGDPSVQDYSSKMLHLAWHPEDNIIAAAASNSLYMYCQR